MTPGRSYSHSAIAIEAHDAVDVAPARASRRGARPRWPARRAAARLAPAPARERACDRRRATTAVTRRASAAARRRRRRRRTRPARACRARIACGSQPRIWPTMKRPPPAPRRRRRRASSPEGRQRRPVDHRPACGRPRGRCTVIHAKRSDAHARTRGSRREAMPAAVGAALDAELVAAAAVPELLRVGSGAGSGGSHVSTSRAARRRTDRSTPPRRARAPRPAPGRSSAAELAHRLVPVVVAVDERLRELPPCVFTGRPPSGRAAPALDERPALAGPAEPPVLEREQHHRREVVVEHRGVDVGGLRRRQRPTAARPPPSSTAGDRSANQSCGW